MLRWIFSIADDGLTDSGSLLQVNVMRKYPSDSSNFTWQLVSSKRRWGLVKAVQAFFCLVLVFLYFDAGVVKMGCLERNGWTSHEVNIASSNNGIHALRAISHNLLVLCSRSLYCFKRFPLVSYLGLLKARKYVQLEGFRVIHSNVLAYKGH